jgi:hypothetical protein
LGEESLVEYILLEETLFWWQVVDAPPCLSNGYITSGSFNAFLIGFRYY